MAQAPDISEQAQTTKIHKCTRVRVVSEPGNWVSRPPARLIIGFLNQQPEFMILLRCCALRMPHATLADSVVLWGLSQEGRTQPVDNAVVTEVVRART